MMKFFNFRAAKIIFFIESQNPGRVFRRFHTSILEFLYFGHFNFVVFAGALLDLQHKNLHKNRTMKKYMPLLVFSLLLLWSGCSKDDNSTETKASFTFQITANPGEVSFTNKSENAQAYEWDFGDGKASLQVNPVHAYDLNGTYLATLKAFGSAKTVSFTDTIVITNVVGGK